MLCEVCKTKIATIHMTEIIDGEKREIHLCEECASIKGVNIQPTFSINEVLGSLLQTQKQMEEVGPVLKCPSCGINYNEFRSGGRFGCSHDYVVFKEHLDDLLEKIHGSTQHMGKMPDRMDTNIARQRELMVLKEKLDRLVQKEAYEEAAKVRDKIKRIEDTLYNNPAEKPTQTGGKRDE